MHGYSNNYIYLVYFYAVFYLLLCFLYTMFSVLYLIIPISKVFGRGHSKDVSTDKLSVMFCCCVMILFFPNPDSINGNYIPSERICIFFCWDQGYCSLKQLYFLSRVLGLTGLLSCLCCLVLAVVDWYLPSEQY